MFEQEEKVPLEKQVVEFLDLNAVFDAVWGKSESVAEEDASSHESLETSVSERLSVEAVIHQVEANKKFHLEWMGALGSVGNLFAHGGALCAHCVTAVGGGLSSAGSAGIGGLPGIGMGHWHADGSWHAEDDHQATSKTKRTTPSFSSPPPSKPSSSQSFPRLNLFPENTISLSEAVAFGKSGVSLNQFIESLVA